MGGELSEFIKRGIDNDVSLEVIKSELLSRGYLENDVDSEIERAARSEQKFQSSAAKKQNTLFSAKGVLEKVGFGFANNQFINILFYSTGASLFFIGLMNGIRTIISTIVAMFLNDYSKVRTVPKRFISMTGLIFGFSFFLIAMAVMVRSPVIFALAMLLGVFGVAAHGDAYHSFLNSSLPKEKRNGFLKRISFYGLLITAFSLLMSGLVIDYFGIEGSVLSIVLFGRQIDFRVYGFLLSFEITAFAFIFSSLIISKIDDVRTRIYYPLKKFISDFCIETRGGARFLLKHSKLRVLMAATVVTSSLQLLGNSYYGIFIFKRFTDAGFGGYLNVALVFLAGLAVSFAGPFVTKKMHRHIGISPMIVFGTMLMAMMPIALAFNPYLYVIVVASALSVIGSSITAVAQSLLAHKILSDYEKTMYFRGMSLVTCISFLVLIPLGALYTNYAGMAAMFRMMIIILFFLVTPLNFIVVLLLTGKKQPVMKIDSMVA